MKDCGNCLFFDKKDTSTKCSGWKSKYMDGISLFKIKLFKLFKKSSHTHKISEHSQMCNKYFWGQT